MDLGAPAPANYAQALAISPNGDIAGNGLFGGDQGAFRLTRAGQLIRLANLPAYAVSVPAGVTTSGRVFGRGIQTSGPFVGVVWSADGTVVPIAAPGATGFIPGGVNESELVPGTLFFGGDVRPRAAVWRQGTVTDLGTLGPAGSQSSAAAVNASGQVVGTTQTSAALTSDLFIWTETGGMKPLGRPAGTVSAQPAAINDCGMIAGSATTTDAGLSLPWRWSAAAGFVLLPLPAGATFGVVAGIDSVGAVYGNVSGGDQSSPYVWYRDRGEPLPGGSELKVRGVNACGMAIGTYQLTSNDGRIAVWARPGC